MITSPLLSNVHQKAMITPVSPLLTTLVDISPSYWTIYCLFEIILEIENWTSYPIEIWTSCPPDWTSYPMFHIRDGQTCWVAEFFAENQKHQRAAKSVCRSKGQRRQYLQRRDVYHQRRDWFRKQLFVPPA